MDIAKLFDGMYTCMWEYTHRVVCFLTIHEKDGLYNSTKVKALLRFISEIKKLGYEFSFDNTVGMMIERIGAADLQAGNIDWKTTLERAAESGTLPPMMTFYIGKVSHG